MLALSRKVGERIVIDGGIVIELLKVESCGRARIGISAPRNIGVWREELVPSDPEPPEHLTDPPPV